MDELDEFIRGQIIAAQNIAFAGMKGGYEIAQSESAAKIKLLTDALLAILDMRYVEHREGALQRAQEIAQMGLDAAGKTGADISEILK